MPMNCMRETKREIEWGGREKTLEKKKAGAQKNEDETERESA